LLPYSSPLFEEGGHRREMKKPFPTFLLLQPCALSLPPIIAFSLFKLTCWFGRFIIKMDEGER
jgi:hypothetical protein